MRNMNKEQVLQVTKMDILVSAGGAAVLTAFIIFLTNVLV
ncbi:MULTISPECIES: DUF3948 family protein [Bacillus]|uniref:DUF3948 family protein n=6 Tax=Bacillus cereus group TaxID=86661 RepID=A0ABV3IEV5_9BACI|nr:MULTISPECIES: DUF3948 family protein [Bacillus]MBJ7986385.1 DUF3948 family protein [Bacillus cereus]MBJ8009582.1 DUF3948 family protein [Bacillus cereus]MBJ8073401.1 DUF3948 family protein [Bacillus cereus]MBJ8096119.1 DUF3948 family protein [Bacillus cereus]MBJ8107528.1 DUF3948 family protein [Bacillus cereus group sp. N8]